MIFRPLIPAFVLALSACAALIGDRGGDGGSDASALPLEAAVVEVLEEQVAAWNRGDLEAFMDGYWRSPDLIFTSGGQVQRGWQTTFERYSAAYGESRDSMGRLGFTDLEVHPLGSDAAWVMGRWSLAMSAGERGGVFTLVFQRIGGDWLIVHDHTSESRDG